MDEVPVSDFSGTRRQWIRWLTLIPISGFILLSLTFIDRYRVDATWYPSCHAVLFGTKCGTEAWGWLVGAILWATLATALILYFVFESLSKRATQERTLPVVLLVAFLLAVLILGMAGVKVADESGYGRMPEGLSDFILFAFLTLGLLVSGLTFAEHKQSKDFWTTISQGLAIVVGGGASALAIMLAYTLLCTMIVY